MKVSPIRLEKIKPYEYTADFCIRKVNGYITDDQGRIAILHDNRRRDGLYGLPGGKIGAGESIQEGLTRELKEEIGVDLISYSAQGYGGKQRREGGRSYNIIYNVQVCGTPKTMESHSLLRWLQKVPANNYFGFGYKIGDNLFDTCEDLFMTFYDITTFQFGEKFGRGDYPLEEINPATIDMHALYLEYLHESSQTYRIEKYQGNNHDRSGKRPVIIIEGTDLIRYYETIFSYL